MADTKLQDLTEDVSPTGDDLLYVVSDPAGAPADRKVTIGNLLKALLTAGGDILFRDGSGNITRLAIGSANQVLKVNGGLPSWQDGGGGQAMKSLAVQDAYLPDDSAGNAAAQIQIKTSSGSNPKPRWHEALFDDTTDEMLYWAFFMPDNYDSSPDLKVAFKMASATSGSVVWQAALMAVTPGDAADMDADSFAGFNGSGQIAVPGTAGHTKEVSISLSTNDSVAAGDFVILVLRRDADSTSATDDATGDAELLGCKLEWTSS
jgi:hypothetical protein